MIIVRIQLQNYMIMDVELTSDDCYKVIGENFASKLKRTIEGWCASSPNQDDERFNCQIFVERRRD